VFNLLSQLSRVYSSMRIDRFEQLAPEGVTFASLEKWIASKVRTDQLSLAIDHRSALLIFKQEEQSAQAFRGQLTALARALVPVVEKVKPTYTAEEKMTQRAHVMELVKRGAVEEYNNVASRKQRIESIKQQMETVVQHKARQKNLARVIAEQDRQKAEAQRIANQRERQAEKQEEMSRQKELKAQAVKVQQRFEDDAEFKKIKQLAERQKSGAAKDFVALVEKSKNGEEIDDEELLGLQREAQIEAKKRT